MTISSHCCRTHTNSICASHWITMFCTETTTIPNFTFS